MKLTKAITRPTAKTNRVKRFSQLPIKLISIIAFACNSYTPAFALNPVPGWYAGLILGVSKEPSISYTVPISVQKIGGLQGDLTHNVLGNVGGQIGYRCNNFRVEVEGIYNNNPMNTLSLGNVIIESPSTSTTLRLKGQTQTGAGFINGYYDFFAPDNLSSVVPFVGLGAGYATTQSTIQFFYNDTLISEKNLTNSRNGAMGQGIIGVGYFMDDFTVFGLDLRYMTSFNLSKNKLNQTTNNSTNFKLYTINLTANGAFDFG